MRSIDSEYAFTCGGFKINVPISHLINDFINNSHFGKCRRSLGEVLGLIKLLGFRSVKPDEISGTVEVEIDLSRGDPRKSGLRGIFFSGPGLYDYIMRNKPITVCQIQINEIYKMQPEIMLLNTQHISVDGKEKIRNNYGSFLVGSDYPIYNPHNASLIIDIPGLAKWALEHFNYGMLVLPQTINIGRLGSLQAKDKQDCLNVFYNPEEVYDFIKNPYMKLKFIHKFGLHKGSRYPINLPVYLGDNRLCGIGLLKMIYQLNRHIYSEGELRTFFNVFYNLDWDIQGAEIIGKAKRLVRIGNKLFCVLPPELADRDIHARVVYNPPTVYRTIHRPGYIEFTGDSFWHMVEKYN
jgi:hypothetical protein